MADYTSTIALKAITSDIDKKLKGVKKNLKGVTDQVKKAQVGFKKMSASSVSSLKRLDAKVKSSKLAIAGFAASFALLAGQGVKAFKVWEDGLNQIQTLGVKDMKMVIDQLKSLRREYGITGAEATKGYYDIVSAGAKAGAEAMDQLTAATKLAKAGNTDLDKAVKIVTSGVKVFGEQGETATSIINKLFLAVKYGKTTVAELGNQFGLVAPIMKSAGLGMSDYSAAMAAITAGSIETTVATTGLKAIMSNIVKVTPKAEKAAARLGIEFNVAALKAKGFVGFMQDIKEKTGGSITEIGKLFESIEAINAVAVLTSDAGIADLIRNFAAMKDSAGTVKEAMDIVRKSFSFNLGVFSQQMKIMSETIGSALVPTLISLASAMAPIVELISAFILQYPGIVKITAAVTAFVLAWSFLGIGTTLIITGIITALTFLSKKFDIFADGGAHAFNIIIAAWHNLIAGIKRSPIGKVLGVAFDFVADAVAKISWDKIKASILTSWEEIKKEWNKKGEDGLSLSLGEKIINVVSFVFPLLTAGVKTAFDSAWTLVTTWWDTFDWKEKTLAAKEVYAKVKAVVSASATDAWTSVKDWWTTIDWTSKVLAIKEVYAKVKAVVSASATDAWTSVKDWWTTIDWTSKVLAVKEVFAKVKAVVSASATDAWTSVKDWWTTIDWTSKVLAVKEVFAKVKAVVSASATDAWTSVKDWWTTIDWTSKVLAVKEVFAKVKAVVSASATDAWTSVEDWWTTIDWASKVLAVKEVFAKVKAVVSASATDAWTSVEDWWTTIDWASKVLAVKEVFAKVKAVVSASATDAWTSVEDWWTTIDWASKVLAVKEVYAKIKLKLSFFFSEKDAEGNTAFDRLLTSVKDKWIETRDDILALDWNISLGSIIEKTVKKVYYWFAKLYQWLVGSSIVPETVDLINKKFGEITIDKIAEDKVGKAADFFAQLKKSAGAALFTMLKATTALNDTTGTNAKLKQLESLIVKQRLWNAAISDDYSKSISTDKASFTRAMENASVGRKAARALIIAEYKTLGQVLGKEVAKGVDAEISKLVKDLEGKIKPRGWLSRFFLGDDLLLSWQEKFLAFFRKLDERLRTFGRLIDRNITALDTFATKNKALKPIKLVFKAEVIFKAAEAQLRAANTARTVGQTALVNAAANLKTVEGASTSTPAQINVARAGYNQAVANEAKLLENAKTAQNKVNTARIANNTAVKALATAVENTKNAIKTLGIEEGKLTERISRNAQLLKTIAKDAPETSGINKDNIKLNTKLQTARDLIKGNTAILAELLGKTATAIGASNAPLAKALESAKLLESNLLGLNKAYATLAKAGVSDSAMASLLKEIKTSETKLTKVQQLAKLLGLNAQALESTVKTSEELLEAIDQTKDAINSNKRAIQSIKKYRQAINKHIKLLAEQYKSIAPSAEELKTLEQLKADTKAAGVDAKGLKAEAAALEAQMSKLKGQVKAPLSFLKSVSASFDSLKTTFAAELVKFKTTTGILKVSSTTLSASYKLFAATVSVGFTAVGGVFKSIGGFLSKVPGAETVKNATKGAGAKLGNLSFVKGLKFILKKILIPLVLIYDAYKGFTDLDRIAELTGVNTSGVKEAMTNLENAEERLANIDPEDTNAYAKQVEKIAALADLVDKAEDEAGLGIGTKAVSAISNAIGNFISGFFHLFAFLTDYLDLSDTTDALNDVDLAKTFADLFQVIKNVTKIVKNIVGWFGSDGEDGFNLIDFAFASAVNTLVNTINGVVSLLGSVTSALAAFAGGEFGRFGILLMQSMETIFNYILSLLPTFNFKDLQEKSDAKYAFKNAEYDLKYAKEDLKRAKEGTDAHKDATEQVRIFTERLKLAADTLDKSQKEELIAEVFETQGEALRRMIEQKLQWEKDQIHKSSDKRADQIIRIAAEIKTLTDVISKAPANSVAPYLGAEATSIAAMPAAETQAEALERLIEKKIKYESDQLQQFQSKRADQITKLATEIERLTTAIAEIPASSTTTYSGAEAVSLPAGPRLNRYGKEYAAGGAISGPGTGTSDSIPAMLSNGEFVINAKAARGNQRVLEMINSGNMKRFAEGGPVSGQTYDYLQSTKQGTGDLLGEMVIDWEKAFKDTIGTLEKGSKEFEDLTRLWEDAVKHTSNMNYEEAKSEGLISDLNAAFLEANINVDSFDEAVVGAAGAVTHFVDETEKAADDLKKHQGDWAGTFASFTGPLKDAAVNATDFGEALKNGVRGLVQTISKKLLDRAFKPIEDAMDMIFNDMFGTPDAIDGSDAARALYVKIVGRAPGDQPIKTVGRILTGKANPHDGTVRAVNESTRAIIEGTESNKSVFGSIFGNLFGGGGSSGGGGNFLTTLISSFFGGGMSKGGIVPQLGRQPQYFAHGGMAKGTDTVPAMLTPGEMVLNKKQQGEMLANSKAPTYNITIQAVDYQSFENMLARDPKKIAQLAQVGKAATEGIRR